MHNSKARADVRHQHTANEQSVTSEDDALVTILHEVTDTVLRVTWRVQSADRDAVANLELLTMCWRLRDRLAVTSSDDGEFAKL